MRFLCLAYEEEAKLNALTPSEWDELRRETLTYKDELDAAGYLIIAHALKSVRTATTVRVREGSPSMTDGPFAETKETLGGFFLIEAKDLDQALKIAAKWPSARLGSIEVRPIEAALPEASRYL